MSLTTGSWRFQSRSTKQIKMCNTAMQRSADTPLTVTSDGNSFFAPAVPYIYTFNNESVKTLLGQPFRQKSEKTFPQKEARMRSFNSMMYQSVVWVQQCVRRNLYNMSYQDLKWCIVLLSSFRHVLLHTLNLHLKQTKKPKKKSNHESKI